MSLDKRRPNMHSIGDIPLNIPELCIHLQDVIDHSSYDQDRFTSPKIRLPSRKKSYPQLNQILKERRKLVNPLH